MKVGESGSESPAPEDVLAPAGRRLRGGRGGPQVAVSAVSAARHVAIPLGRERALRVIEIRPGRSDDDEPVLVVEPV
jgi:hypothetical protein